MALRRLVPLLNEGAFIKSAGTGVTSVQGSFDFHNSGTVEVQSGTLSFAASGYRQSAGATILNGGSLATGSTTALDIQGGSLVGSGTVDGNVSNAGEIHPGGIGAAGTLTITRNFSQAVTGTLYIELGGLAAGTEHDQLVANSTNGSSGAIALDRALDVSLINGFNPLASDAFIVLTYQGTRTGVFATIDGHGRTYTPNYNANDLTVVAQ